MISDIAPWVTTLVTNMLGITSIRLIAAECIAQGSAIVGPMAVLIVMRGTGMLGITVVQSASIAAMCARTIEATKQGVTRVVVLVVIVAVNIVEVTTEEATAVMAIIEGVL